MGGQIGNKYIICSLTVLLSVSRGALCLWHLKYLHHPLEYVQELSMNEEDIKNKNHIREEFVL
jgi:hypothetical protein